MNIRKELSSILDQTQFTRTLLNSNHNVHLTIRSNVRANVWNRVHDNFYVPINSQLVDQIGSIYNRFQK